MHGLCAQVSLIKVKDRVSLCLVNLVVGVTDQLQTLQELLLQTWSTQLGFWLILKLWHGLRAVFLFLSGVDLVVFVHFCAINLMIVI